MLPFILQCCVYCMRVVRLCFWFDCFACMIVLQVVVDAFAFACCTIVLHISRVCKLHVLFCVVGSLICAFMIVLRVIVYAFAFVCCKVAFHIVVVEIACLFFFCVVAWCLLVCVFCV